MWPCDSPATGPDGRGANATRWRTHGIRVAVPVLRAQRSCAAHLSRRIGADRGAGACAVGARPRAVGACAGRRPGTGMTAPRTPIVGYRVWRDAGDHLLPLNLLGGAWTPGVITAGCHHASTGSRHPAPDGACSCGLYALHAPP